ncbi:MAG: hypothetical protein KTR28_07015 [Micavibrio sp.]|nr:hypothetical protein [Micavibrio sp.]
MADMGLFERIKDLFDISEKNGPIDTLGFMASESVNVAGFMVGAEVGSTLDGAMPAPDLGVAPAPMPTAAPNLDNPYVLKA